MPNNSTSFGIETDHTVGEAWPTAQLASLRKGTAAILRRQKLSESALHFHKTICDPIGRKVDPAGLELLEERRRVHALLPYRIPKQAVVPKFPGSFGPGSKGPHVAFVQKKLGVDTSEGGLGTFGPRTRAAVVAFQRKRPWLWPADGVVGPKTYRAIAAKR